MKLCLLVVALSLATVAAAQPADTDAREARLHYKRGLAHYNLQEYTQAVDEFEAAYRRVPDPSFLYNLAQAHRLANHPERALHFYRVFLHAVPNADNRGEVERRIADLEKLMQDQKSLATPPNQTQNPTEVEAHATAPEPPDGVVARPEPPPKKTPAYKKWWVWTLVGVGAAGAAVGLGVGLTQTAHVNSYPGLAF